VNSDQIREAFLRFFEEKGHTILPSSSLIPQGDPTLLLTTAGMVQIKPYFLGLTTPPNPRLASCQKCFRTTDIDQVGDTKHLTFFEMLGNFSVGDYFKKEAIEWAWEFVTQPQWLGLSPDRLWISIFLDDEEAFDCWREIGVPTERIIRLGEEDNFWGPAGDSGPCGPCSEIHYDFGEDLGCGNPDCGPACDCARFSEIWNLVFTQYDQDREGVRAPLPKPNIDTGMGLERVAAVMQGKNSVYQADLFAPIIEGVARLSGKQYGHDQAINKAIRIVAEHARGITFLIADGLLPGNEGRGYVLRRILRRSSLFGRKLGLEGAFLSELAEITIERMGHVYPELLMNHELIRNIISLEEESFGQALDTGLNWLDRVIARAETKKEKTIRGVDIFTLYDTYGFPPELSSEIAIQRGFSADLEGFEIEMERQRERARSAHKFNTSDQASLQLYEQLGTAATGFVGYDKQRHSSSVVGLLVGGKLVKSASLGEEVEVILEETPFYGEMGGQIGDSGEIRGAQGKVEVSQAIRPLPEIVVHRSKVTEGQIAVNDRVEAEIDQARRLDIARNHTATHVLQATLRAVLGEQVRQSGSLVAPDRLRFDFTYLGSVSREQLAKIQHVVNEKIRQNLPVLGETMPYTEAISRGAIAIFGEKYGDEVRVLQVGDPQVSLELCGGTHVRSTGEIGFFHITSEGSIGSGVRRIEAITGREAERVIIQNLSTLDILAKELGTTPEEVQSKLSLTLAELDRERKRVISLEREIARGEADSLLDQVKEINGIKVISAAVSVTSLDAMREIGDRLRGGMGSGIIVLGAVYNSKPNFMVMVTPDLTIEGFHAGEIVKKVAGVAGGGGGGKAEMGQGSGKDISKLDEALRLMADIIVDQSPKNEDFWLNKGEELCDSGRYEEAITCFDNALDLNPENLDSWITKGWILGKLEKHEEALACYDKVIELDPMDELAWYNKANRLCVLGRHKEAIDCYDRATLLSPYDGEVWYNKGICFQQLGQEKEANEYFQRAKELGFPGS